VVKINGRFGDVNWAPIVYQFRSVEFPFLAAMYNLSAIALITPLRDGMNLVAKEYIASRTDNSGVLILSEMAGASKELGEAIIINPNHKEDIARALKDAVEMPLEDQAVRVEHMQNRLKTYDIARWANDFLVALDRVKETQRDFEARLLNSSTIEAMRKSFRDAQRKLIFLDYDGTLVPYAPQPMHAVPDQELCKLLNFLARDIETDLVLISGRDRSVIDKWFGAISMGFVAENGAWIKGKEEQWRLLRPLNSEWKKALYPILKVYADRLPGAFIEQKEHSLVWHFRQADPEHASLRARELVDQLTEFTANIDIQVLRGSKVVEIRNSGISKASAAMSFLSSQSYDFILAIGDDWTDEDLFKVLPVTAYTIKVGITQSHARYNVTDYKDSRMLLKEISQ
jgi:trehalose 6-phosphate synthase/phosphatase